MQVKDIGEFDLIGRISADIAPTRHLVSVGIGDDSAAFATSEDRLLLATTDMLVENVHFRTDLASPFQIGWRSLASNISDIAAMGGEPTYALISLGLPGETAVRDVQELYAGIRQVAMDYSVDIIGGDTVSAPQIVISIALLGEVEQENLIQRSGAKPGDVIVVTGDLGGSGAGLIILDRKLPMEGTEKHLTPTPRAHEGRLLAKSGYVTSMIDISDGLASEIHHICMASGTGAELRASDIPLSDNVHRVAKHVGIKPHDLALYGGEDYELLFTCQPDKVPLLAEDISEKCGTPLTVIGRITNEPHRVTIEDTSGRTVPLAPRGYAHFTTPFI